LPVIVPPSLAPLSVADQGDSLSIAGPGSVVSIAKNPWRLSWSAADGTAIVKDANPGVLDPVINPQYELEMRPDGIHQAYPGLPTQSFMPLAYMTGSWQSVSALSSYSSDGSTVQITAATSDGAGATVTVAFGSDGALQIGFKPAASGVSAVEASFDAPLTSAYFGGGERFSGFNMSGRSVPLWISHGELSDRYLLSNEIATPFFWSPAAGQSWGLWSMGDARGEIDFADPTKRADAVGLMREDDHLDLVLYAGTPTQIVSAHTARSGRPGWTPPQWMWQPMVWNDNSPDTASVLDLVNGMQSRNIPLGAVWLDNPWDAGYGSFNFDTSRFPDPDGLISTIHGLGVHLMVWVSPFIDGSTQQMLQANNWLVTGLRADNNDATYYPTRGLDPHLDFTNPAAYDWWVAGLRGLIRRGIDGVKMDRCEEDLSETSVWANGLPNRFNHNPYCVRYHSAAFQAFSAERPDGDFTLLARGGWTGDAQYTGYWASDNLSIAGPLGMTSVLNSLLSLSASGMPFDGSDIGGYDGTLQDDPTSSIQIPDTPTYVRWAELGALSPVMETDVAPWWLGDTAVAAYQRYATLHSRLAPYTAAAAQQAIQNGVPIVRPLAYAYPGDPLAVAAVTEYLYGPDLLVSPVTELDLEAGVVARTVYLPEGTWTDFWSGDVTVGPALVPLVVPQDQIPLFVRAGAQLPAGVSAAELP
jgi:alpha-D-xyloside xylohydrolase